MFGVALMFGILLSMGIASAIDCTGSPGLKAVDTDGAVTFVVTCTDFTANITNDACTLNFTGKNPGSAGYVGTVTNTTATTMVCTKALTQMPDQALRWDMTITNGTTSSTSTTSTLIIDIQSNSGAGALAASGATPMGGATFTTSSGGDFFSNLTSTQILIGLGAVVLLILIFKKKK